eukprot:762781-Hanusia_phi.AAC.11
MGQFTSNSQEEHTSNSGEVPMKEIKVSDANTINLLFVQTALEAVVSSSFWLNVAGVVEFSTFFFMKQLNPIMHPNDSTLSNLRQETSQATAFLSSTMTSPTKTCSKGEESPRACLLLQRNTDRGD